MASPEFSEVASRLAGFQGNLALVGSCKNAGKTTVLNFLLERFPSPPAGVTSIGYDGESVDSVYRHAKPSIFVSPDTLFATAQESLARSEGSWTVLERTGRNTALGEVALARANDRCRLELAGPSELEGLMRVCQRMRELGARKVFIDGAFDRVASAAVQLADAVVLAAGSAGRQSVEEAAQHARLAVARFQLPLLPAERTTAHAIEIAALTDDLLPDLNGKSVLLPDPSRCLIDSSSWRWIESGRVRVFVRRRAELMAVFTNPFRPHRPPLDARALLAAVGGLCQNVPVFDLRLEGVASADFATEDTEGEADAPRG